MFIERIELQNIKSYGSTPTIIEFGAGVNLIAGMNGAGKSTILEAIGFTLFDALPYSQKEFERRGSSGPSRVVVRLRSSYDDRRYDIERTVNPSNYTIYDVEEQFRDSLESKTEALEWLKQHLNIEQTTNLDSLFHNAVGMQQGTITSVFLDVPRNRKSTFDALLHVEDYDEAWKHLRDTQNYVENLIAENKIALAVAQNTISTLTSKPKEFEALEVTIEENEQLLEKLNSDLERLNHDLEEMNELSKKASEQRRLETELAAENEKLEQQRGLISEIEPQTVERSRLNDEVQSLEDERKKNDEIIIQCEENRVELQNVYEQVEVTLKTAQEKQRVYETINDEIKRLKDEKEKAIAKKEQIESELERRAELDELISNVETDISKAQTSQTQAKSLIKASNDKLDELQQMRALLREEGIRCPVCRQYMHGEAHSEAIQYYDGEDRKLRGQTAKAETQLKEAEEIIKQENNKKEVYEKEIDGLSNVKALEAIDNEINSLNNTIFEKQSELDDMPDVESIYQRQVEAVEAAKKALREHDEKISSLNTDRKEISDQISDLKGQIADLASPETLERELEKLKAIEATVEEKQQALWDLEDLLDYDEDMHALVKEEHNDTIKQQSSVQTRIEMKRKDLDALQADIQKLREAHQEYDQHKAQAEILEQHKEILGFVRNSIRDAGPRIRERKVRLVSEVASNYFSEISNDYTMRLDWNADDYGITIEQNGEMRPFQVLSGGEQMIAALSVRLALLTHLTRIRLIFLDEPTINLDDNRRVMLAEQLSKIQDLQQLFVISHDDTFVEESNHVIRLEKAGNLSKVS